MTRDNRQILVNPHSSIEKIPIGALNLGEIAVQHNNVEDAALYVETVADSESASTIAKFITEKAIENKIEAAADALQLEIDGINEAVGLPHEESGATPWGSGSSVWNAIETAYAEMTANFDAVNNAIEAVDDKVDELSAATKDAIDELEAQINANEVSSANGSIVVVPTTGGTDISVNIDGHSIVLNNNNELVADLKLSAITPSSTSVKEEYALFNYVGEQLGESIKIYKDSSLYRVYLGHVDDTIVSANDPTVVPGSGDTALCFIYEKSDGSYELVAIDVEDFLEESEFADGLQVDNHIVSVKVDAASEEVVVDASGNTAPVLSVGPNGVKISNIQNAINTAANKLQEELDEVEAKLNRVSVSEGASVENLVFLSVTNNENGATAITLNDAALKDAIDDLSEDIAEEVAARQTAIDEVIGNSASTSAETSIMGVKEYVNQVVSDLDADAVQEVEFAAVVNKDSSNYGSNAGATVVPMDAGEVGKKLVLDFSLLKLDCGEY